MQNMNADIYFISDAHLGSANEQTEKLKASKLISFLKEIQPVSYLYIIGDLFDFWFEYRTVIPNQHSRVLWAIADLVDKGTKVVYIAGNHDFWLGDFLEREVGLEIHLHPLKVIHQGITIYISHGDGLAKWDRGYRILRSILRNRTNIRLYRLLHPDLGLPLARKISALSRIHVADKQSEMFRDYVEFARKKFDEGIDVVILAHTHQPIFCELNKGIYLNVGDWITHFTYGKLAQGKISLDTW